MNNKLLAAMAKAQFSIESSLKYIPSSFLLMKFTLLYREFSPYANFITANFITAVF